MPDEVDNTAIAEPEAIDDAPLDTAGGTGDEPVDRDTGFLSILEGKQPETAEEVEKPTEPEKPAEKPEEKKVDAPKTQAPPDAADDSEEEDDDTILDREELDKRYSNSPKGLRKYADNLGKKYAPVAAIVDELGGVDAVKRLDKISTLITSIPSRADAPEVVDLVKEIRAINPAFAGHLNTNIFYGAIDENPTLMESVVKLPRTFDEKGKPTGGFGPNWSIDKLMKLTQLVDDGEIDLDDALEVANRKIAPEELARREAQSAADKKRDDEIAELRKSQEDALNEKKQNQITADTEELGKRFSEVRESVWRQFKLLPVEGDPDDLKQEKERQIKKIMTLVAFELRAHPVMQAVNQMINSQSKGDGYGWAVEKAAGLLRGKSREIALAEQKQWSAYLKQYNQPAASNVTQRRPEPLAEGALATEREPSPTERAQEPLSPEERKAQFQAILEGKRQVQ